MGTVNATASIPAEQEHVWNVLVSPGTYEEWLTIHTKWKSDIPEQFTEGATAAQVVTMLGMANTITWTVETLNAPECLTITGTGMAGVQTTFSLAVRPDGSGGSEAQIDATFDGAMIVGALGKAVEQDAQKNLDASLENLARLITA